MKITPIRSSILITLLSLVLFAGCSGKTGKSTAKFDVRLAGLTSLNNFGNGGAMLYGQSDSGDRFGKRLDNILTDSIALDLPNATWSFSVLLWDGDHDSNATGAPVALTGKVRCGRSLGNSLTGGDVTISINASNGNCALPAFSPEVNFSTEYFFPELEIKTCRPDLASVSSEAAAECIDDQQGLITSARVILLPYKNIGGQPIVDGFGDALEGPCLSLSATSGDPFLSVKEQFAGVDANYNIPGGVANSPFKVALRGYFGVANCDGTDARGFEDIMLPNGFSDSHPLTRVITHTPSTDVVKTLLVRTPDSLVCNGPRGGLSSDFSTGGRAGSYFNGICNADQFDFLSSNYVASHQTSNFILLRNINYFDGIVIDPSTDLNIPEFPMIGTPTSTNLTNEPNPYGGLFEGNNKSIIGMRIDKENESGTVGDLGFVRSLGATGIIRNMNFILPEIWADSYRDHKRIGIVAGSLTTGAISNITVQYGGVEGRGDVGGIVGRMSAGALTDVEFLDGEVDGLVGIGGIAGYLTSAGTITRASFVGGVLQDGPDNGDCSNPSYYDYAGCIGPGSGTWTDGADFGGIVGFVQTSGSILESTSKGVILGNINVGGLVGRAETTTITDSYSLASVLGSSTINGGTGAATNAGGIAGSVSAGTWTRVFHTLGTVVGPGTGVGAKGGSGAAGTENNVLGTTDASTTYAVIRDASSGPMSGIFTAGNWAMDDTGFDFPRLVWEPVRFCSGKFAGTYAGGDGSAGNPYLICSSTQLSSISSTMGDASLHYKLARPIDLMPLSQTQNAIVSLSGAGDSFEGTFDGDGMIMSNLDIDNTGQAVLQPMGLFPTVGVNGVVKNFTVMGKVSITNTTQSYPVGTIAGINNGVIDRVNTFGKVESNGMDSLGLGGIVGLNNTVVIGGRSQSEVSGNTYVGGIAGRNIGGLIKYSSFGGRVTPYASGNPTSFIGGITGLNDQDGTAESYYDPSYDEFINYDGLVDSVSVYGSLSLSFGIATNDQVPITSGGLLVGENRSVISNIESYGRVDLNLGLYPTYQNNTADCGGGVAPTVNPGELHICNSAGGNTIGSLNTSWAIGDGVWNHGGVTYQITNLGSTLDTSVLTAGSTVVAPFTALGAGIGKNTGASASVENIYFNQNTDYSGAQYFGSGFGSFVGINDGGATISNSIFEGDFNFPGSNTDHLDLLDNNHMIRRDSASSILMVEVDTATTDGATSLTADSISTFQTTTPVVSTDIVSLGSYQLTVDTTINAGDFVYTAPSFQPPSATSLPLFIPDLAFNDTNYPDFFEIDLGWGVGDANTWRVRNSGTEAGLNRVEGYEENYVTGDLINLINSY